jgi:hypothetical protein
MRRYALIFAVCVVSAGIAGVLTARDEPPPRLSRLLDEIPPLPGSYVYPLGHELHVDGVPREMGWALTDISAEAVLQRYAGQFAARGLEVDRLENAVVALSRADRIVRSVVAERRDDGKTVVLTSLSEPMGEPGTRAPLPPACDEVRSTGARDGAVQTEVASLECAMPIEQLLAWFDAGGGVRDAQVLPEPGRPDLHATWSFEGSHVTVLATQTSDSPPRTAATITWQEEK